MELPLHEILANESGQVGLADEDDRGPLTGVYAYARLTAGGYSEPIVMSLSEVKKHEDVAKTDKFWRGPWRPDMFLKTAIHKLYDRVPHSQEYLAERIRAMSAEPIPGADARPAPAPIPGPPRVPSLAGNGAAIEATAITPPAAPSKPAPPSADRQAGLTRLTTLLRDTGIATDPAGLVLAVVGSLARTTDRAKPVEIAELTDLNDDQLGRVNHKLDKILSEENGSAESARNTLLEIAAAAGWQEQQEEAVSGASG
jgi:hypothetical protein